MSAIETGVWGRMVQGERLMIGEGNGNINEGKVTLVVGSVFVQLVPKKTVL